VKPDLIYLKGSNADIYERVTVVLELIVNGARRPEILRYAREDSDWGVSWRQVDNYIKRANDRLLEIAHHTQEQEFRLAYERLTAIYGRAFKDEDWKSALAAQKEIHKLFGLTGPDIILNNPVQIANFESMSFEQLYELKHGHKPESNEQNEPTESRPATDKPVPSKRQEPSRQQSPNAPRKGSPNKRLSPRD